MAGCNCYKHAYCFRAKLLFKHAYRWCDVQDGCLLDCCHSINMPADLLPLNQYACRSFTTHSCMFAGVVYLYLPYLRVWCLTISRACCCGASLWPMPSGVMPHYQPCFLVCCLTIGHAFWCGPSLSTMPIGVVPH